MVGPMVEKSVWILFLVFVSITQFSDFWVMSYRNWKQILGIFNFHNSVFNGIFVIKHTWRDPLVATFDSLSFFFSFFFLLHFSFFFLCSSIRTLFLFFLPFRLSHLSSFFLSFFSFLFAFLISIHSFFSFLFFFFFSSFLPFSSQKHKPTNMFTMGLTT